jgi:hypothetical protein
MNRTSAAILIVGLSLGLTPAMGAPPRWVTVFGLARVNGQSKKVDGRTYHLVALYFDPRVLLLGTNTTDVECLLNGKPLADWTLQPTADEKLPGASDLRLRLTWLALPEKGDLEVLFGPVHHDGSVLGPDGKRKQMREGGFVPYTVGVDRLPAVKATTVKQLAEAMEKEFGKH